MAQGEPGWIQLLRLDSRTAPVYAPEHIQAVSAAVCPIPRQAPAADTGGFGAAGAAVQVKRGGSKVLMAKRWNCN